ncbi:MAG: hypothetical protein NVS4B12_01650 [Ktedonobacteraceae bacterium]
MSASLDVQKPQGSIPSAHYDVVVMGAGPYGLSAAAHLQGQGLKVATFGKPIHFWREHMPEGMLLRSYWWATHLSDPEKKYSFKQYFKEKGIEATDPLPIDVFIDYGLWFQKNAVPNLDETYIKNVEHKNNQFIVTLEDDRIIVSDAMVLAPGLHYYAYYPKEYTHMPHDLVSHSSDHHFMNGFFGKQVAVIGAGQAALETSALLHEQNTEVHILARHPIRWIRVTNSHIPEFLRELRAPQAGMGNGWLNWLHEHFPYSFHRLPRNIRDYFLGTRHGSSGSRWLQPRITNKVMVHEGAVVSKVEEQHNRVILTFTDDTTLEVDHAILATGYKTDVKRLPMLASSLIDIIQTYLDAPVLNRHFECSVPGLYFIGFSAVRSFGFLYRFVIGDDAAAKRVARAVAKQVTRAR